MARRPLKPQLNQIRTWVRQGRTDAWIAHQLQVTVKDIDAFKREHGLTPDGDTDGGGFDPLDDDLDLRAEDDALVAAELDAEPDEDDDEDDDRDGDDDDGDDDRPKRRRRGRRGGRGRGRRRSPLEGTFDHGEEGYGLWLDPAVQDDPVYAEHWAGHRPVVVSVEADRIVIRRAGENGDGAGDDDDDAGE
ncbi:MAG TPA: hypothetical protein VNT32_09605 [Thermoleophilaceae bacterium]|nr:hypothetical protein [Thermoleophilaceae bacterium]